MGTFTVTVEVGDPQGQRFESVQATVDTGASDTLAPRAMLERLGVPVQGSWPFTMADDREIEYDIGQTDTDWRYQTHRPGGLWRIG